MPSELILTTERLAFRRLQAGDAAFILKLLNEPSFHKNTGDRGVRDMQQATDYLLKGPITMYTEHGFGMWMVSLRETGAEIGLCGLIKRPSLEHVDVGFAFFPAYWGKGYASEAANASCEYGRRTLGIKKIVGIVSEHNQASIRILEKLGMKFQKVIEVTPGDPVLLYE